MRVLAIETSTARGSLALVEGDTVLASEEFRSHRAHNAMLFEPLERVLELPGARDPEIIVVGTGPGSYSGVRVGIAVANALGLALDAPVLGIPSLLAPSAADDAADYTVVGDARRHSFFRIEVRGNRVSREAELMEAERFTASVSELLRRGETVITFDEVIPAPLAEMAAEIRRDVPGARNLASLAQAMGEKERAAGRACPLEPIYLRAPFITRPGGAAPEAAAGEER